MPKPTPSPQHVSFCQPLGWTDPLIHCPLCGKATVIRTTGEVDPCPHLLFVHYGVSGCFEHVSDDLSARLEKLGGEEAFDCSDFPGSLRQAGYDDSVLVLEVTYGGIACGPAWSTDTYGFGFRIVEPEGIAGAGDD